MIVALGYIASAFLAYSLIVTNAIKFRWLNILGCIFFILYGLIISAFPVLLANSILLCINIYQLVKLYKSEEVFQLLPIEANNKIVEHFIHFYKDDIHRYFPQANTTITEKTFAFVVLRDLVIANIFIAHINHEGNAIVEMNYTIQNFRDYKIGKFIFEKEKSYLINQGIQKIIYNKPIIIGHEEYITRMGFEKIIKENETLFIKSLL